MLFVKKYSLPVILFGLISCSNPNPLSNLFPDDTDLRGTVDAAGLQPGDSASNFTFYNSDGSTIDLSNLLASKSGVVLYFTMWCPVCETHMDHMRINIKPDYPNVSFYLIDYVSSTVSDVYSNQYATGYLDFAAALDYSQILTDLFAATMSSTIVIDKNSVVVMNEDFKDGQRLIDSLNSLP
jgi:thiol-disulfide isomerase/thioredoxin